VSQRFSLGLYRGTQAFPRVERMGPPRLGKPALKDLIGSFEKHNERTKSFLPQPSDLFKKVIEKMSFSYAYYQCGLFDRHVRFIIGLQQARKRRKHRHREVVDAKIPEVFERVRR
jgi:hypothetical protein